MFPGSRRSVVARENAEPVAVKEDDSVSVVWLPIVSTRYKTPATLIKSPTLKSVWNEVPTPTTFVPEAVIEPISGVLIGLISAVKFRLASLLSKKNALTSRLKSKPAFNCTSNKPSL